MSDNQRQLLITGASSYLGQALVAQALTRGHRVIAVTHRPTELKASAADGQFTHLASMDLTCSDALERLATTVQGAFRGAFGIVNCTGYFPGYMKCGDLPLSEARKVMESNFLTLYGVVHTLLPLMLESGNCDLVTFSAHSQYQCYPLMGAFNSAKAAVEAFTLTLSNEYLHAGIRANCFALATMLTPQEVEMKPHGDHSKWLMPEEVALRVVELLERADPIISGNIIQLFKHSDSYFGQSYLSRVTK